MYDVQNKAHLLVKVAQQWSDNLCFGKLSILWDFKGLCVDEKM